MANILSIRQVINLITDIGARHNQIHHVFEGRNYDLVDNITYPLFQFYLESARYPQTNGQYKTVELTFNCKVLDLLVNGSKQNSVDASSDTQKIAADIINEINQHPYYLRSNVSLVGDINMIALDEYSNDFTAGHEFIITLKCLNVNTYCGLPFDEIEGYSAAGAISTGYTYVVNYMPIAGGVFTGAITGTCGFFSCFNSTSLSGNSIYLSGVSLNDTFLGINSAISSATTAVQNGLNTYTGGTILAPTINVSGGTFSNVTTALLTGNTFRTNIISGITIPLNQINFNDSGSGLTISSPKYIYVNRGNNQLYIEDAYVYFAFNDGAATNNQLYSDVSQVFLGFNNGVNSSTFLGDANESSLNYYTGFIKASSVKADANAVSIIGDVRTQQDKNIFVGGQNAGITNSSFIVNPNHLVFFTNSGFTGSGILLNDGSNAWNDPTSGGSISLNVGSNSVGLNRAAESVYIYAGSGGTTINSDTVLNGYVNILSATTDNTIADILVRDTNGDVLIRDVNSIITGATSAITNTFIQNGINTYTGGTQSAPTVNVSALTISTLTASGDTNVQGITAMTLSATSIYGSYSGTSINTAFTDAKIKGSVAATVGSIPYSTGVADTVTSTAFLTWNGTSLLASSASFTNLTLNTTNTSSPSLVLSPNGTVYGYVGAAGASSGIVVGSVVGDLGIRSQSRSILFSVDGGVSVAALFKVTTGDLGVGVGITPSARLHLIKTTEQLRVGYDTSNYFNATVSSTGTVKFSGTGSDSKFIFEKPVSATTLSADTITISKRVYNVINPIEINSATTIDWSTNNVFDYTLTAATTFSFSNIIAGQTLIVAVRQPIAAAGFNYSFSGSTVYYPAGTTPTITTTTGKTDIYTFVSLSAGTVYGSALTNF